jgi:hypothetical protein
MTKQLYIMAATVILLTVCALAPAKARSSACVSLKATIPFEFNIGKTTLPAGEYVITRTNRTSDQSVLQFRSKDGRARTVVQMHATIGKASEAAKLVFNRYGAQYFFAQAWMPYDRNGVEASKSHAERSMQRELNRAGQKGEMVALRAR